jgi:hypothetical protein
MLLSARSMLKRVSIKLDPQSRARLSAMTDTRVSSDQSAATTSAALALAREQISARPGEFVSARQQANGE